MFDFSSLQERILLTDIRASAILYSYLIQQNSRKTIILPVNICGIVPEVLIKAGYTLEFVDIDTQDYCPDQQIVLDKIAKNSTLYSGIIDNFTYGVKTDRSEFYKELKTEAPRLFIIEDRCSKTPSLEFSEFADLTLYSTGYAKQVDIGFGGFGIVNGHFKEAEEIQTSLCLHADGKNYQFSTHSFPSELNSYFREITEKLDRVLPHKELLNKVYEVQLPEEIQMASRFNHWRFNILVKNKQEIIQRVFEAGIFASSHFTPLQGCEADFPVAYGLHSKVINLFNDLYYSEEQAYNTCKIINKYL